LELSPCANSTALLHLKHDNQITLHIIAAFFKSLSEFQLPTHQLQHGDALHFLLGKTSY